MFRNSEKHQSIGAGPRKSTRSRKPSPPSRGGGGVAVPKLKLRNV